MTTYLPPSEHDATLARDAAQAIARAARNGGAITVQIADKGVELPASTVTVIMDILGKMAAGKGVTITPQNPELTTEQAAEILNVSRPYLIKLLEEDQIPYRKVGTHRRVLLEDVLNYRAEIHKQREAALDEMVALGQAMGEYDE